MTTCTSLKASSVTEELNSDPNKLKINGIGPIKPLQQTKTKTKQQQVQDSKSSSSLLTMQIVPSVTMQSASIKNSETDRWITIQINTLTNWINEQLKGEAEEIKIVDLKNDLANGVILIKLISVLQKPNTKILAKKFYRNPQNQHQCLENISLALNAVVEDGVRLVNIGT